MLNPKCKICRRAGTKLFLKGERCYSQKCAIVRKNYPPGNFGRKKTKGMSEYGLQLREKQRLRRGYGISERQLENYFTKASLSKKSLSDFLLELLERRLDNTIFRSGFAESRSIARQLASHGHFRVNGRKVTIPSYQLSKNDVISIRPQSKDNFKDIKNILKGKEIPAWLTLDREKLEIKVIAFPVKKDINEPIDVAMVIEYYSR